MKNICLILPVLVLLLSGCTTAPQPASTVPVDASLNTSKDRRVIRTWNTEATPDGRTIQVPTEIYVDQYGRQIAAPKPGPRPKRGRR